MESANQVIGQTKKWILDVVIGCQFCPFAAKEFFGNSIHFQVENAENRNACLEGLLNELRRMDNDPMIRTALVIYPHAFGDFSEFLDLVYLAEKLLLRNAYEGIYQLATFHPDYRFAKSKKNDPANYTNRSIYPMLHILREDSLDAALAVFPNPKAIPERNQQFARDKGEPYMKKLRADCL